jgi:hypothetical protein
MKGQNFGDELKLKVTGLGKRWMDFFLEDLEFKI